MLVISCDHQLNEFIEVQSASNPEDQLLLSIMNRDQN